MSKPLKEIGPEVWNKVFGFSVNSTVKVKSLEGTFFGIVLRSNPVRQIAEVIYYNIKLDMLTLNSVHFQNLTPYKLSKKEEKLLASKIKEKLERELGIILKKPKMSYRSP